jgi:hypothetical protein
MAEQQQRQMQQQAAVIGGGRVAAIGRVSGSAFGATVAGFAPADAADPGLRAAVIAAWHEAGGLLVFKV